MTMHSHFPAALLRAIGAAIGAAAMLAAAGWFALVQAMDVAGAVLAALI